MAAESFKRYRGWIYAVSVYHEGGDWVALVRIGKLEDGDDLVADIQFHDRGHSSSDEAGEVGDERARSAIDGWMSGGHEVGNG